MAEWIFPANARKYRIDDAFQELRRLDWSQNNNSTNVAVGDTVFIYSASPTSAITWKCIVLKTHKNPSTIDDGMYKIPPVPQGHFEDGDCIELMAVQKIDAGPLLTFNKLKENGLNSILRSPTQLMPGQITEYIHSVVDPDDIFGLDCDKVADIEYDALEIMAENTSRDTAIEITSNTRHYVRSPFVAEYAKKRANGICQLCKMDAPFKDEKGRPYLESHHIEWLSEGGADSIDNTVALCPNCHRRMHILKLDEDVEKLNIANANL